MNEAQGPVVLFDGWCVLCNGWAEFVARRDHGRRIRFATLQSPAGRELLAAHGMDHDTAPDSVVLIDAGQAWRSSTAALRVVRHLAWPWPLVYGLVLIPRPLRNAIYHWVGNRRYRWFGRRDTCGITSERVRQRILPAGE